MRLVLLALLLSLPLAAAGIDNPDGAYASRVYLHVDGMQDVVMSPIPPPDTFRQDHMIGPGGHSICAQTPGQALTGHRHQTHYAVVTPAPIDYGDGHPRAGYGRGIQDDLRLAGPDALHLNWFISMGTQTGEGAGVLPNVVLEATLREGDDLSVGHVEMNAGRIVAHARTEPATLSPALSGHPQVSVHDGGNGHVYQFSVPLNITGDPDIEQASSFNLRIDTYVDNPYCAERDHYTMAEMAAVHSSPEFRPALDVVHRTPVQITRMEAAMDHDALRLDATLSATFGAGDVRFEAVRFEVAGPSPIELSLPEWCCGESANGSERTFPPYDHERHEYRLLQYWQFAASSDGQYNVTLTIPTDSGAIAQALLAVSLGDDVRTCTLIGEAAPACATYGLADQPSPHAQMWALLVGMAALAGLRRRIGAKSAGAQG